MAKSHLKLASPRKSNSYQALRSMRAGLDEFKSNRALRGRARARMYLRHSVPTNLQNARSSQRTYSPDVQMRLRTARLGGTTFPSRRKQALNG